MTIGILALQGDFEAHARVLECLGVACRYVRRPQELREIDALILPGGESTTLLKFLEKGNFFEAVRGLPEQRKPVFGTCAGAILLAKEVTNPPQPSLALMDVTVERNAYGPQVESAIRQGKCALREEPIEMVFIRAPIVRRVGKGVRVLASCAGLPVALEQGYCLLATFHPELTADTTLHQHFLQLVASSQPRPEGADGSDTRAPAPARA